MIKKLTILLGITFVLMSCAGTPNGKGAAGCDDKGTGSCVAVGNVLSWLTEDTFKKMTPLAHPGGKISKPGWSPVHTECRCKYNNLCGADEEFYSYTAFVAALKGYPDVFLDKSTSKVANDDQQRRIVAAIFANSAQETNAFGSDSWDPHGVLCWVGESGFEDTNPNPWSCAYGNAPNGYCYNGRGPLQLTHGYNYQGFSQDYFGDDRAYKDPRIVSSSGEIAFASALWFFANYVKDHNDWKATGTKGLSQFMVTPRKYKNKKRDFAYTIFLINGGIECGASPTNTWGANNRITAFKIFFQEMTGKSFNDKDDKLECEDMTHITDDYAMANAPVWG